jgi:hypothetical protein
MKLKNVETDLVSLAGRTENGKMIFFKAFAIVFSIMPAMAQGPVTNIVVGGATITFATSDHPPSLNDLPQILQKLRDCKDGTFGQTCAVDSTDLWVSVHSDGALTIFRHKDSGDNTFAEGRSVQELLQNFATQLTHERAINKTMLDALAPYLPSQ